tara:strand:- start:378 stop:1169 length:792 start_codon:yes stop_codon:yes gene_type:complete
MADTLTFEQNTEVTSVDNLSAEEQDSLQVGEQMQEAVDKRLAGKYENAEQLEKAYIELEKKLGEGKAEPEPQEDSQEPPEPEAKEESKDEDVQTTILDDLWDQATAKEGKYNNDTLAKLNEMKPQELAKMHLEYRAKNTPRDLTEQDVKELKGIVGGDENYSNMLTWAQQNLNEQEVSMFDQVMEQGNPLAAFFAVRSLAYRYNDAVGFDGNTVTGTAPKQNTDVFRSQAEVVEAMGDRRYERDPAYRRDIMEKLKRSPDVNF